MILSVNLIVFPGTEGMIAQCVNFDFAAQGRTAQEAIERFQKAFVGQLIVDLQDNRVPFSSFKPTPPRYTIMYQKALFRCGPLGPMPMPRDMPMVPGQDPMMAPFVNDVRVW
jgi:hypothetical protein